MSSANENQNYQAEVVKRLLKYLIEGLAVALAAFLIPSKKVKSSELVILGVTAATVFALLDTFSPSISIGARHGTGFGLGVGLTGGL